MHQQTVLSPTLHRCREPGTEQKNQKYLQTFIVTLPLTITGAAEEYPSHTCTHAHPHPHARTCTHICTSWAWTEDAFFLERFFIPEGATNPQPFQSNLPYWTFPILQAMWIWTLNPHGGVQVKEYEGQRESSCFSSTQSQGHENECACLLPLRDGVVAGLSFDWGMVSWGSQPHTGSHLYSSSCSGPRLCCALLCSHYRMGKCLRILVFISL